jgi:hypothetical protein
MDEPDRLHYQIVSSLPMKTIDAQDAPLLNPDALLPCDVILPNGTIIETGCSLRTLIVALRVRGMVPPS